jgi:hypothetical protein
MIWLDVQGLAHQVQRLGAGPWVTKMATMQSKTRVSFNAPGQASLADDDA